MRANNIHLLVVNNLQGSEIFLLYITRVFNL